MYKPSSNSRQVSLFWDLETMLDSKHPVFKLANMVDWSLFEKSFSPLFCSDNGRPPKPIRLMTGLIMLKLLRNVSDEQVAVQRGGCGTYPQGEHPRQSCHREQEEGG